MNKFDLEKRTLEFSKEVIRICKLIPKNVLNLPLINQIIRSATSIGANYREANGASSKKDFKNKIHICKKESQETAYWIELLSENNPDFKEGLNILAKESREYILIFGKITSTISKNLSNNLEIGNRKS